MTTPQIAPALRFPNFSCRWETLRLGELCSTFRSGSGITSDDISVTGRFPVFGGNGLRGFTDTYTHDGRYLLIGRQGALCGNINLVEGKTFISEHAIAVEGNDQTDTAWLAHRLDHHNLNRLSESSAQPGLSVGKLTRLKFHVPTLPEQRKIAEFLTAVDGRIGQLSQKKALLEDYKKGVMQQLFTQSLRFKDDHGNDFPEWEEKKLSEVSRIYDGTHTTPNYTETGVPFYSVEHLTRGSFEKTKFISEAVFEKENKRVKLERGDILMTRIGDIGTSKLLDWEVRASFYVSLALIKIRSTDISGEFVHHSISSNYFQRELWQRTIHVAFPKKINLGEIGECFIKLPSFPEQTKIADFLTALDRKIESVSSQITHTQTFKKGLLQQMFV